MSRPCITDDRIRRLTRETKRRFGSYFLHSESYLESRLSMTIETYDRWGNLIAPQYTRSWWPTQFNPHPRFQDMGYQDLVVFGTVDFSKEPDLWDAFLKEYKNFGKRQKALWCVDDEDQTAHYVWPD